MKKKIFSKLDYIIVLGTYLLYYAIGFMLHTDLLNAITFRKHGFSISFFGVILLVITSVLIKYIIVVIEKCRGET